MILLNYFVLAFQSVSLILVLFGAIILFLSLQVHTIAVDKNTEISEVPLTIKSGDYNNTTFRIDDHQSLLYKRKIEDYFNDQQPFLNSDYSLAHLVNDLNIPRYMLSAFINKEYGMGFREFLNRYRVEYFIKIIDDPESRQFTIQALAEKSGFISRATFSKHFKQLTGKTYSEYIKDMKEKATMYEILKNAG